MGSTVPEASSVVTSKMSPLSMVRPGGLAPEKVAAVFWPSRNLCTTSWIDGPLQQPAGRRGGGLRWAEVAEGGGEGRGRGRTR